MILSYDAVWAGWNIRKGQDIEHDRRRRVYHR
jgi:hypothetical protein